MSTEFTTIYAAKSNLNWGDQKFRIGDKISYEDYSQLSPARQRSFREIKLDVRHFVEDLLIRVHTLESEIAELKKLVPAKSNAPQQSKK